MRKRLRTAPDGTAVYTAIDGDMVDMIAHRHYGIHGNYTEEVYRANPGLAELGSVLTAGVQIRLPKAAPRNNPIPVRRLWD